MIPTIEIDENGDISTLYTDQVDLYSIGKVCNVRRASNVEFNEARQEWDVVCAKTGSIVHSNKNREDAIEWEIDAFQPGGLLYHGNL